MLGALQRLVCRSPPSKAGRMGGFPRLVAYSVVHCSILWLNEGTEVGGLASQGKQRAAALAHRAVLRQEKLKPRDIRSPADVQSLAPTSVSSVKQAQEEISSDTQHNCGGRLHCAICL